MIPFLQQALLFVLLWGWEREYSELCLWAQSTFLRWANIDIHSVFSLYKVMWNFSCQFNSKIYLTPQVHKSPSKTLRPTCILGFRIFQILERKYRCTPNSSSRVWGSTPLSNVFRFLNKTHESIHAQSRLNKDSTYPVSLCQFFGQNSLWQTYMIFRAFWICGLQVNECELFGWNATKKSTNTVIITPARF